MFKKVIYNTASQIAAKVVTSASTLLITVIVGRSLGPAGYGDFTKIFTFVGYFYTIADFGFNAIYIKFSTEETKEIIRALVGLRLLLAIFLAVLAASSGSILPYNGHLLVGFSPLVKVGIAIASLTIVTQALFTSANAFFQKNLRYDLSAIASVTGTLVILFLAIIGTLLKAPLIFYVTCYVAGGLIFIFSAYLIILKKFKTTILPVFSRPTSKKFISSSWPIGVALFFNLIYFHVDIFILALSKSSSQVGLYGLAYQFFEAALAIPIFFSNSLYPLLSNLFKNDKETYQKEIKVWSLLLFLFSLLLIVGLFIVSLFIPIIIGPDFSGAQNALRILALGMPFFFISALFWHMLIIHDRQKTLIYIYAAGAIFNVITNLIFIPKFGYLAASIVTVISEGLITILLIVALKSPFPWQQTSIVAPDGSYD